MEIAFVSPKTLRIRGKQTTLVVDPDAHPKAKATGDVVIGFTDTIVMSRILVEGQRLAVTGPGEYEVGGIKMTGRRTGEHITYDIRVDGIDLLLTTSTQLKLFKDSAKESDIMIVQSNETFDESSVTALSPKVLVLYGQESLAMAARLGKEVAEATQKFQTTLDKLPTEMEIVVLG